MRTLLTTAAALALLTATATAANAQPHLALPEPTGPLPTGQTQLHLVDHDRPDLWAPEQPRELMLTLWYPTATPTPEHAPYVTTGEAPLMLDNFEQTPEVDDDILATTTTHAHPHTPPITPALPLVVLSPGFTHPRAALTGLAEDLASRGYAVAAIGHNHEARGTEFPDGRITTCRACTTDDYAAVVRNRAHDISFVLDQLPRTTPLRPNSIALAGHSIGGASAAHLLPTDPRVRAAINLDGTFHPTPTEPIDEPLLMLGTQHHRPGGIDPTWDTTWNHLTGWKRWLTVTGTDHASFTDFSTLSEQFGIGLPNEPLTAARTNQITRNYVAAFLDHHLRGLPQPLLNHPAPHYPEVRFEHHAR